MSLTDKIQIVNGEKLGEVFAARFTAAERGYIIRAILNIPQHIEPEAEGERIHDIIEKLRDPEQKENEK